MKQLCAISPALILVGICLGIVAIAEVAWSQTTSQQGTAAKPGSQNPQAAPSAKPPATAAAPVKPPPSRGDLLLEAAWLAMKHRPEISVAFHEHLNAPGLKYALDGRYCLQPGNKLWYERTVRIADSEGSVKFVIDGQNYWVVRSLGTTHAGQTFKFADLGRAIDQISKDELS